MTKRKLFRSEVEAAGTRSWLGEIRLASPVNHTVWAASAIACGAIVVAWLALGEYTRRERVQGQLVPTVGLARLKARSAGEVLKIEVAEGDTVHAGDPLVVISAERYTETAGGVAGNVAATLEEQKATLRGDIETARDSAQRQQADLTRRIELVRDQIARGAESLAIYRDDAAEQTELSRKIEPLREKGYVSASQIQEQRSAAAAAKATVARQLAQQASLEQQLRELEGKLAQVPLDMATQINGAKRELARADVEIDRNDADRNVVIRAPSDGVVSSLLVHPGQTVAAGAAVVALVPKDVQLEAELLVRSAAIGFVRPGSRVALHYRAFPFQKFGVHAGTVRSVSKSALTPAEVAEATGVTDAAEAMYRVRVALREQSIATYDDSARLIAGMVVDADVMLDRRRIYEWLFEPVYTMRKKIGDES